jgi:hypothetical protein
MDKRKNILKEAGVLLTATILILTAIFVFTPLTKVGTAYLVDFESGNGGFTTGGAATCWAYGMPTSGPMGAYSGFNLWATNLGGSYNTGYYWLESPEILYSGGDLQWWQWYYIETSYDGGNVKISEYPYDTWTLLTQAGLYTGTANSANPLYPDPIFTGSHQIWTLQTIYASSFPSYVSLGDRIKFRFDFGADSSVNYAGWYIDDVDLPGNLIVNNCPDTPSSLLVNGGTDPCSTYLQWYCPGDIDGDSVTYTVYLGTSSSSPAPVYSDTLPNPFYPTVPCTYIWYPFLSDIYLLSGETYQWYVTASDLYCSATSTPCTFTMLSTTCWSMTDPSVVSFTIGSYSIKKIEVKISNHCSAATQVDVEMKVTINPATPPYGPTSFLSIANQDPAWGLPSPSGDTITWHFNNWQGSSNPNSVKTFSIVLHGCAFFDVVVTVHRCGTSGFALQKTRHGCIVETMLV